MKSFTDIEQSRKLAEFLPIESADMAYIASATDDNGETLYTAEYKSEIIIHESDDYINCWSLAALLGILSFPALRYDIEDGEGGWIVSCENNDKEYLSYYRDNPVDTCYEMILRLHSNQLL